MRAIWQLIRCCLGRHLFVGFTSGSRTIIVCEYCGKRLLGKRGGDTH
jgi:hypothetical protein